MAEGGGAMNTVYYGGTGQWIAGIGAGTNLLMSEYADGQDDVAATRICFQGRIIHVRKLEQVASAMRNLMLDSYSGSNANDPDDESGTVGFDMEWRPQDPSVAEPNPIALIQMASGDTCLLFHMLELGCMPPQLCRFLENEAVQKVCHGFETSDKLLLEREYGIEPRSFVDTEKLAQVLGSRRCGLSRLVNQYWYPQYLDKTLATSDWQAGWLSREQILYAATDAWVTRELYFKLRLQQEAMLLNNLHATAAERLAGSLSHNPYLMITPAVDAAGVASAAAEAAGSTATATGSAVAHPDGAEGGSGLQMVGHTTTVQPVVSSLMSDADDVIVKSSGIVFHAKSASVLAAEATALSSAMAQLDTVYEHGSSAGGDVRRQGEGNGAGDGVSGRSSFLRPLPADLVNAPSFRPMSVIQQQQQLQAPVQDEDEDRRHNQVQQLSHTADQTLSASQQQISSQKHINYRSIIESSSTLPAGPTGGGGGWATGLGRGDLRRAASSPRASDIIGHKTFKDAIRQPGISGKESASGEDKSSLQLPGQHRMLQGPTALHLQRQGRTLVHRHDSRNQNQHLSSAGQTPTTNTRRDALPYVQSDDASQATGKERRVGPLASVISHKATAQGNLRSHTGPQVFQQQYQRQNGQASTQGHQVARRGPVINQLHSTQRPPQLQQYQQQQEEDQQQQHYHEQRHLKEKPQQRMDWRHEQEIRNLQEQQRKHLQAQQRMRDNETRVGNSLKSKQPQRQDRDMIAGNDPRNPQQAQRQLQQQLKQPQQPLLQHQLQLKVQQQQQSNNTPLQQQHHHRQQQIWMGQRQQSSVADGCGAAGRNTQQTVDGSQKNVAVPRNTQYCEENQMHSTALSTNSRNDSPSSTTQESAKRQESSARSSPPLVRGAQRLVADPIEERNEASKENGDRDGNIDKEETTEIEGHVRAAKGDMSDSKGDGGSRKKALHKLFDAKNFDGWGETDDIGSSEMIGGFGGAFAQGDGYRHNRKAAGSARGDGVTSETRRENTSGGGGKASAKGGGASTLVAASAALGRWQKGADSNKGTVSNIGSKRQKKKKQKGGRRRRPHVDGTENANLSLGGSPVSALSPLSASFARLWKSWLGSIVLHVACAAVSVGAYYFLSYLRLQRS